MSKLKSIMQGAVTPASYMLKHGGRKLKTMLSLMLAVIASLLLAVKAGAAEVNVTLAGFGALQYDDVTGGITSVSPTIVIASVLIVFIAVFTVTWLMTGLRKVGQTGKKSV